MARLFSVFTATSLVFVASLAASDPDAEAAGPRAEGLAVATLENPPQVSSSASQTCVVPGLERRQYYASWHLRGVVQLADGPYVLTGATLGGGIAAGCEADSGTFAAGSVVPGSGVGEAVLALYDPAGFECQELIGDYTRLGPAITMRVEGFCSLPDQSWGYFMLGLDGQWVSGSEWRLIISSIASTPDVQVPPVVPEDLLSSEPVLGSSLPLCEPAIDPGFATEEEANAVGLVLRTAENQFIQSVEGALPPGPEDDDQSLGYVPGIACQEPLVTVDHGNRPLPHAGPHHNGAQTTVRYKGAIAKIEVTNPVVTHGGDEQEFVASRVMGKKEILSRWLEVGWAEVSWRANRPFVFTFNDADGQWRFWDTLVLNRGTHYAFRVNACRMNDQKATCSWIYYGGRWRLLDTVYSGACVHIHDGMRVRRCFLEQYTEVFSNDATPHPALDRENRDINWEDAEILKNDGWHQWTPSSAVTATGQVDPYRACWEVDYYDWYAKRNGC